MQNNTNFERVSIIFMKISSRLLKFMGKHLLLFLDSLRPFCALSMLRQNTSSGVLKELLKVTCHS